MALTLDDLKAKRDALITRMASLEKRITAGDRTVEYDLTQAQAALALLDKEIAANPDSAAVKRYSFNAFSKG